MNRKDYELTCKPLDSYEELMLFVQDPPPWRTLCKGLTPHSTSLIRNIHINNCPESNIETPETFCHFDSDADDVQRCDENKLPKTLVCHDMANGYHDDSIIDGTGNYDAYTFYNWAGIDIFCYFSHHLITIPPVGWINVGHAHGVKVIGTVITEWNDGVVFWDKILSSEVEYRNFASALVAVAKTLKFDGWLLNIENKILKPDVLLEFVKYFHRTLHQELPAAELIWYDSVTVHGDLIWQNGLNNKNKAFFDACDGLFTNYSWSEGDVSSSARIALADRRITDLYIGIDVWGRNFYGGGQFNTQTAVKVAHKYGCSLAIFAPAWTHEAITMDKCDMNTVSMADDLDKYGQFLLRDRAFWGSLWRFSNTRVPCQLPFQTSFCRGQGLKRRLYGEVLCPVPWYNLRHMQYQPNSAHGPHGYLLTTSESVFFITQNAIYKDESGTTRYREFFQSTRRELHSITNKEIHSKADVNNELDDEDEQINLKIKVKRTFKDMFKHKETQSEENKEDVGSSANLTVVQIFDNPKLKRIEKRHYSLISIPEERECLEIYLNDSFIGGSCLKINPSDDFCPEHRLTRLFHCNFHFNEVLVACVVTKCLPDFKEQYLNVKLFMKNANDEELEVILAGKSLQESREVDEDITGMPRVYPLNESSDEEFRELQKYLLLNKPGFYVPVENAYDWIVRYYVVIPELPGARVTSINLRTGFEKGPVLLGYFGLCERSGLDDLK